MPCHDKATVPYLKADEIGRVSRGNQNNRIQEHQEIGYYIELLAIHKRFAALGAT
jgi:hypothetical protein